MPDENYWKDAYSDKWGESHEREIAVAARIIEETGLQLEAFGLGAGSSDYLAGSADSQGFERGDPDFHIIGTDIYIEVTGPLSSRVRQGDPLWIRPDKVEAARRHLPERRTYVVHCLDQDGLMRVIPLGEGFFRKVDSLEYPIETRFIRGRRERYMVVPSKSGVVRSWTDFIEFLQSQRPPD